MSVGESVLLQNETILNENRFKSFIFVQLIYSNEFWENVDSSIQSVQRVPENVDVY